MAVAHSMGGGLTALALAKGERRFSGVCLTALMFGTLTRPFRPGFAWARGQPEPCVRAGWGPGAGGANLDVSPVAFENNVLTHDPARYARNEGLVVAHPDLALGPPTWGWLDFAFAATRERRDRRAWAPLRVGAPMTVVAVAGDDRLVNNFSAQLVTARFPRGK